MKKKELILKTESDNKFHIIFIFILLLNYLFPLIIFGNITLFYHDTLDAFVAYNHILGKVYSGEFEAIKNFLSGNVKIEYMRGLLKPQSLIYAIFNTELAYWITDFLIKITGYISFFIFSKKINKNIFTCSLTSCLFASLLPLTYAGFGLAIFPYILYLTLNKTKLNTKHIFILVFFGLCSDLIHSLFFIPIILLAIYIIDKKLLIKNFKIISLIISIFFFFVILASSNLIYAQLFDGPFHRENFNLQHEQIIFYKTLLINIFSIPTAWNWTFFKTLPLTILLFPLVIFSFFSKNETVYKILFSLLFIHIFLLFLNSEFVFDFKNNSTGILKSFNFSRIEDYLPVLQCLLFIVLAKKGRWFYKYLISSCLLVIFIFQINSSLVPMIKKYIYKESNYRNLYTFKGYFYYESYSEIKKIVKDKRVISVGLDPMIAIMNNMKTIDGYHTLYPLEYKFKFRKVIERELKKDEEMRIYYDGWGSRVYAFFKDPQNIEIDFNAAKNLGAEYVISKYELGLNNLVGLYNEEIYLYKIK